MGVLLIGAPAVHIQLHRTKCFPLKITYIDCFILATEDSVHVRTNIRLTGKAGAYISRDMETNIFPHTACLVARPNSGITLCACPTVQRDNERTCIISIVRHNTAYVSHTVQPEGVSGTYPRYVCFQYTHACITNLFHNITLQQSTYAFLRMQV